MRTITLIFFLFSYSFLFAQQNNDKTQFVVKYRHKVIVDTAHKDNFFAENMMLLVGNKSSLYKSYDIFRADSTLFISGIAGMGNYKPGKITDEILNIYDPKQNDFICKFLVDRLYFDRSPINYDWTLFPDTINILGYSCKKAVTISAKSKKTYIAWYAEELPFPTGVESFGGLPGLILKLESKDGMFLDIAYSIGKANSSTSEINFHKDAERTNEADFTKWKLANEKDPTLWQKSLKGKITNIKIDNN